MKQTAFLRCFLTQERVLVDKTLNRENDSTGIIDSCPACRRPVAHTAHPIAQISKVKDLALILLISVFSLSSLHLLSKSILSNRFATRFYLQRYNEMFIVSSMSRCCSGTFNLN